MSFLPRHGQSYIRREKRKKNSIKFVEKARKIGIKIAFRCNVNNARGPFRLFSGQFRAIKRRSLSPFLSSSFKIIAYPAGHQMFECSLFLINSKLIFPSNINSDLHILIEFTAKNFRSIITMLEDIAT